MKTGTVKSFDKNRLFGYIVKDDSQEVFFHFNDYSLLGVRRDNGEIIFTENSTNERIPKKGDQIAFKEKPGRKGPKAYQWTFGQTFDRAKIISDQITSTLKKVYRVMHQYSYPGGKKDSPAVIFEGTLLELNRKHPKPHNNAHRLDDLWPTFSCSDFDETRWFEHQQGNDWVRCTDPRISLNEQDYRRAKRR